MYRRLGYRGFTLIEMMIVLLIIAILSMIMIPYMAKQKYQAQLSNCQNNERSLAAALENYHTREGAYPADLNANFLSAYMAKGAVVCPSNRRDYTLSVSPDAHAYTIICHGAHFLGLPGLVGEDYPQFSPTFGIQLK